MSVKELREQGKVYEWNAEVARKGGSVCPRTYLIENIYNDLFATGFTNHFLGDVNGAVGFFPILMYTIARCVKAKNILEIGLYQGFTSYYLAKAAKFNGGHFYGIDIDPSFCSFVHYKLIEKDLPHTIVCANTKKIKKEGFQKMFEFPNIDFAFLDGEHNEEALLNEVELIYPHLTSDGRGFICFHDVYCICDGAWSKIVKDKRFESLAISVDNGLGIARKIEGLESVEDRAARCGVKKLGCQMGETLEQLEERHLKGDFYTDYVNSIEHDQQMREEHPEMINFPDFDRLKERERRYPSK